MGLKRRAEDAGRCKALHRSLGKAPAATYAGQFSDLWEESNYTLLGLMVII